MKGEIRIPRKLLVRSLADKQVKMLRLLACAKLQGHRAEIQPILRRLKIQPRTGRRLIRAITDLDWAGNDGTFLFPRSWRSLGFHKRGGLYIITQPKDLKKFEALCFAHSLKKLIREAGPRSIKGRALQEDLPTGFLSKVLGIKERRFKMLKAAARSYRFITVSPQTYEVVGKAKDIEALKKHSSGVPVFVRGKSAVIPGITKIKVNV